MLFKLLLWSYIGSLHLLRCKIIVYYSSNIEIQYSVLNNLLKYILIYQEI